RSHARPCWRSRVMTGIKVEWALGELDEFISQTVLTNNSGSRNGVSYFTHSSSTAAADTEVTKQAQVIEKIFDRVVPGWRTVIELRKSNRWTRHQIGRAPSELQSRFDLVCR